ncbi:MAG: mycothione reductase [Sciscionella sp.]|nr:mycothione reductase [Sciscionella sp.]
MTEYTAGRHFDLVIIGTGSGNSILDSRFADWNVAIIEKGIFGGTCLNVGCIPTKMFVHTADIAATPENSAKFGVDETLDAVRFGDIRDRIFGRIDPIAAGGRDYRLRHEDNRSVTVFEGVAHFSGPKTLVVQPNDGSDRQVISADRIVLAGGSRPIIPDIDGLANVDYHTSDTIMRLEKLPHTLVVIGSGFIAAELAHVFSAFGVDVTILARSDRFLRDEDADISARFTELAKQRWDVRTNRGVIRVEQSGGQIILHAAGPAGTEKISGDQLLIAAGRRPNSDLLNPSAAGIAVTDDGYVAVDEFQRVLSTAGGVADGVWALGDICSPWQLKHVANHEQRIVQHNLLHPNALRAADHRFVPHAVFSAPQIASVGLTEQRARELGIRYVTTKQDYAGIAYGWAMEDETGFAKLLADPANGRLLGAHIIGPQASTLIQPLIQAMSFDLSARDMARGQYWIHPAMPELIENALLNLPLD